MSDKQSTKRSEADAELEREILRERKFSLEEAIGRLAGPGAMKGQSPATRLQQAQCEIAAWLGSHLADAGGGLEAVLRRDLKDSELLLNNLDRPLVVLAAYCQRVLESEYVLAELVRCADIEWGRLMDERPIFEREGAPSRPDDPYTMQSVRETLSGLLRHLAADVG
jgi:hypothetical protein